MKYRHIGLGTKIELEMHDENGDRIRPILVSQFETYDEDSDMMEIHAPFFEGRLVPVHPKMVMDIIFSKENDTFTFEAEAIQRVNQGNITLLQVKPLTPITKIQRRSFFRMECDLKIRYRVFETLLPDDKINGTFHHSKIRNISGGGVCVVTDEQLVNGLYMEAFLKLEEEIRFVGQVVRITPVKERGKQFYESGIEFKRIGNREREKVISYIFEEQRNRLKEGWQKV